MTREAGPGAWDLAPYFQFCVSRSSRLCCWTCRRRLGCASLAASETVGAASQRAAPGVAGP